jgi:transcriptional regulator with XRE-family HTH domain
MNHSFDNTTGCEIHGIGWRSHSRSDSRSASMSTPDINKVLGEFLRARRDAADPDELSIPSYGRRRVAGVRREELAAMAGVSASYYVRIEQGAVTASPAVLEAIASALGLDDDDRRHMFQLARTRDYGPDAPRPNQLPGQVDQLMRSVTTIPIGVLGHDMTLLGWNRLAHAVFAEFVDFDAPWSTPGGVNWARVLFCDARCQALFANWDAVTIDVAGRLRTSLARDPDNPAVREIIDELQRDSPRFATLWGWKPVRERPLGTVYIDHPTVGPLELRDTVMRLADADEQLVLVFQAEPGSDSERRLRELRDRTLPPSPIGTTSPA